MLSDETHNLLSLLTATILADKRILSEEVEVFLKLAKDIQLTQNTDEKLSEVKLLSWFELNVHTIKRKLKTPDFEPWLKACLAKLEDLHDKQSVIKIMTTIAHADDEFHISEQALIVMTANHWRLETHL